MVTERLATFLRDSSIPVSIADPALPDCPLIEANPAFEKLTGYERSEVVGKNCRFLQAEFDNERPRADLRAAIEAGTDVQVILKNRRADGTPFDNLLFLFHLSRPDGSRLLLGSQFRLSPDDRDLMRSAGARAQLLDDEVSQIFAETQRLRSESRRRLAESVGGVVRAYLRAGA